MNVKALKFRNKMKENIDIEKTVKRWNETNQKVATHKRSNKPYCKADEER